MGEDLTWETYTTTVSKTLSVQHKTRGHGMCLGPILPDTVIDH